MKVIEVRLADIPYSQTMVFDLLKSTMNATKEGNDVIIMTGNEKLSVEITEK